MKISLLFLTSETLDFESEQVFESHEHLQSTADMMPVLTCFYKRDSGTIVFTSKIVFSINEQLTIVFRAVDNCLLTSGQLSS